MYFYVFKKNISLTAGYWLDGTDILREGVWIWNSTGTRIIYQHWGPYEPNNYGGVEHCLEMKTITNYIWNDNDCSFTRQYICEM